MLYAELAPNDPRRAVVSFVKVVAQTTGRNFVFFHSTAEQRAEGKENGRYEPETNTIYIDINAGINETQRILVDQVLPTVSHELVHIFAVEDPEGFKALSDLVFAGLKESTGHTRSYLISEEINRILKKDPNRFEGKSEETRRAIAEEEIVARACEDRLANSRLMKKFIEEMDQKDSELAQKFSNFLGEAIARLKKIFQQIAAKLSFSKEAQSLRKLTDHLEAIQSQYDALLERRTTEATTAPSEQQKNTSARGVMSAERKEADEDLTEKDVDTFREIKKKNIFNFTKEDLEKSAKIAMRIHSELGVKSPFFRSWFGDWRREDKTNVFFVERENIGKTKIKNKDTGWDIQVSKKITKETKSHLGSTQQNALKYLKFVEDITEKAILLGSTVSDNKNTNSFLFHDLYAYTEVLGYPALLKIRVEELYYFGHGESGTMKRAYILQNIEEELISKRNRLSRPNHSETSSSAFSVSDLYEIVNKYDKTFLPGPFASFIINADGTPKVMYHGTRAENGEFYEFDESKAVKKGGLGLKALGKGNYFTAKKLNGTERYGNRVIQAYLSIKKPFVYEGGTSLLEQVGKEFGIRTEGMSYDELQKEMRNRDYDGVIQYDSNGEVSIAVTFDSNQIKSATDNTGTFDKTNPDIRYSDRDSAYMDAVKNGDTETAQKLVDEAAKAAGYTKKYITEQKRLGLLRY